MRRISTLAAAVALTALGCGKAVDDGKTGGDAPKSAASATSAAPAKPEIATDKGVDLATKTIRIGVLNDESGPAAAIGKPYALGKRILAAQVNAGGSGILPDGWKIELIEKDHGYDPGKSQQAYAGIKDDILFIATSFGTPPTLPLQPFLEKDGVVAFPASLSSDMAANTFTPPVGASYRFESERAVDWVASSAADKSAVKMAILHDQSDYGKDGLAGFKAGMAKHGMAIAAERAIKPGQKDFTAEVTALKEAGATHVLLTILPSSTGPVLGTAAAMQFGPQWIGNTPSWVDVFFAHPKLPAPVFANFHWVSGLPYWGEKVGGMDAFLKAFETHGKALDARPDFYVLVSYVQGLAALEAAKRAIEAKDLTRAGYLKALRTIKGWTAGGLFQGIDLSATPYLTSVKTRILKPDFENKTWTEVAPYAAPSEAAKGQ